MESSGEIEIAGPDALAVQQGLWIDSRLKAMQSQLLGNVESVIIEDTVG